MFEHLTQWCLLKRVSATDQAISLRDPDGAECFVPIALVDRVTLSGLRLLAPGSKIPQPLLDGLLAAANPSMPWNFHNLVEGGLHVDLCSPGAKVPVRFSIAALDPERRQALAAMARGDAISPELLAVLMSLPAAAEDRGPALLA